MAEFDLLSKILNPAPPAIDDFGKSIAAGQGFLVVADPGVSAGGFSHVGKAYKFGGLPPFAEQTSFEAVSTDPADFWGQGVAINSTRIFIGAVGDDDAGSTAGIVYIYDHSFNFIGQALGDLTNSDDRFGAFLVADDDMVLVGSGFLGTSGATRIYAFDNNGTQLWRTSSTGVALPDYHGVTIALGSGIVAVGAPGDDDVDTNAGALYLYDTDGVLIEKVLNPDTVNTRSMGASVAINSQFIFAGATGSDGVGFGGYVHIFDHNGDPVDTINPPPTTGLFFGSNVVCTEDRVAVYQPSSGISDARGAVHVYDMSFNLLETLSGDAPDPDNSDDFGSSLAFHNGVLFVGAYELFDTEPAAVFAFESLGFTGGAASLFWTELGPNAVQGAS